jgi:hypothetical protein
MYSSIHRNPKDDNDTESIHITLDTAEIDSASLVTFEGHTSITIRFSHGVAATELIDALATGDRYTDGALD